MSLKRTPEPLSYAEIVSTCVGATWLGAAIGDGWGALIGFLLAGLLLAFTNYQRSKHLV